MNKQQWFDMPQTAVIGNAIARFMKGGGGVTLNWSLAAAMGVYLLVAILVLYYIYDKVVGIDNMKMG